MLMRDAKLTMLKIPDQKGPPPPIWISGLLSPLNSRHAGETNNEAADYSDYYCDAHIWTESNNPFWTPLGWI